MTDRVRTLTVLLDRDMRDDDAQAVIDAVKMLRHVSDVQLGRPLELADQLAREVARREIGDKLWAVLYPKDR